MEIKTSDYSQLQNGDVIVVERFNSLGMSLYQTSGSVGSFLSRLIIAIGGREFTLEEAFGGEKPEFALISIGRVNPIKRKRRSFKSFLKRKTTIDSLEDSLYNSLIVRDYFERRKLSGDILIDQYLQDLYDQSLKTAKELDKLLFVLKTSKSLEEYVETEDLKDR